MASHSTQLVVACGLGMAMCITSSLRLHSQLSKISARACMPSLQQMPVQQFPMAHAGEKGIPTDELEVAADIYVSLQLFFSAHKELQERPLFITGESYGGKYVPAIGAPHACTTALSLHPQTQSCGS